VSWLPPPRWLRRLLLAPLMLLGTVLLVTGLPVLVVGAALVSPWLPLPGRWRGLRLLGVVLAWLVLESAVLAAAFLLWLAGLVGGRAPERRRQLADAHYTLVGWLLTVLLRIAGRAFPLDIQVTADEPPAGPRRPVIVLSRHAGPGDSFLIVHRLLTVFHRRPRVVMKSVLQLDPVMDVLGNRLPNAFVTPRPGVDKEILVRIRELAAGLDPDGALLIFPEGGNFTARRRLKAIRKLEGAGMAEQAALARGMANLLAPRSAGALAAIDAAPAADVVFVAHTGLDQLRTLGDIWRRLPTGQPVVARWWRVPAEEIPEGERERIDWLYRWWGDLDAWISANRPEPARSG
jgi:1-acyl-sn-glycerol-3-phosphate acyltransferase